jgi:hypothetical protein
MEVDAIEFLRLDMKAVASLLAAAASISPEPIEQIEDRLYLSVPDIGTSFAAGLDGQIDSVFLHSACHEGHSQYPFQLPEGLSFSDSRDTVRGRLGEPVATGGPVSFVQGSINCAGWDRFARPTHSIHVQYADHGIELVTLMTPEAVPH